MKVVRKKTLLVILTIILTSCNSFDKKNIEIIEGIQLGTTFSQYKKQCDSIGIQRKQFFTKLFINNEDDIEKNILNVPVSDIFDLSNFKKYNNHYAILYPTTMTGTDNVVGMSAIIGHTANSAMLTSSGMRDLTKEYDIKNFNQNISSALRDEIKKMLISKYGQPITDKYKSEYNSFFVLINGEIEEFKGVNEIQGELTTWENEYIKIDMFEGVPSFTAVINDNGYQLSEPLFSSQEHKILIPNISKNEKNCVTYVYITYSLKNDIIEKLKLNEKKI